MWRSATTQKQITGYSQMVLNSQKPGLPPPGVVAGKENNLPSSNIKRAQLPQALAQHNEIQHNEVAEIAGDAKDVESFLESVNLSKYANIFVENGVDDLEIILELDDKHLEQMNIPLGHKLKLMKRIKDMRKDRGMTLPESRQGGARGADNVSVISEQSKVSARQQK